MCCRPFPSLKPWLTKWPQPLEGVYSLQKHPGALMPQQHYSRSCSTMSAHSTDTKAMREASLSTQHRTKNHSPAKASVHCDKSRCSQEIVPAVQCYTWYSNGCETWKYESISGLTDNYYILAESIFPEDSSSPAGGHTPACHGRPCSDLSPWKRGDTLHSIGNKDSPARDTTIPPTLSPWQFQPFLPNSGYKQHGGPSQNLTLGWDPVSDGPTR